MSISDQTAELRESIAQALVDDDESRLIELVEILPVDQSPDSNRLDNDLLQLIAVYGCSERTSRYKAHVQRLLDRGVRPNIETCAYLGLLLHAKDLLTHDDSVVVSAHHLGLFPLHAAAERGDLEMVRWLSENQADPLILDKRNELAIMRALHAGPWKPHPAREVIEFLAEPTGVANKVWFAAASGDLTQVKNLVSTDPSNADKPCPAGNSPLFYACHDNQAEIVSYLLEQGVSPRDSGAGRSPLDTACLHRLSGECDLAIIDQLLQHGAELTVPAAVVTQREDAIRQFVKTSPDILNTSEDESAVYYAIHTAAPKSLSTLIELGARPTSRMWGDIERIFSDDAAYIRRLKRLAS